MRRRPVPTSALELLQASTVPPARSGNVTVERFKLTEQDVWLENLRHPERFCPPGRYTKLTRNGKLWMSDTPAERRDHAQAVTHATGRVLVFGLGLGLVIEAMLRKPDVTSIRVIEIDPDVIRCVRPHLEWLGHYARDYQRVEIIEADAMTYTPKRFEKYDAVWADIWADICGDNLPEIKKLRRRWRDRAGWFGAWAEYEATLGFRGAFGFR